MTDARFPDRWLSDKRIQRLSDTHFRAFVTSLTWAASNRTDGVIEPEDIALIPNFAAGAPKKFVEVGLWAPRIGAGRGWHIVDFPATQTTAAELRAAEQKRAKEREKKARQRAAHKGDEDSATCTNPVVPRDIPGDVPPDCAGKDRTGKDRTGKDRQGEGESLPLAAGAEQLTWQGAGPDPYAEYK